MKLFDLIRNKVTLPNIPRVRDFDIALHLISCLSLASDDTSPIYKIKTIQIFHFNFFCWLEVSTKLLSAFSEKTCPLFFPFFPFTSFSLWVEEKTKDNTSYKL